MKKLITFKENLIKIFNNMNQVEGDYVRFVALDREIVFQFNILTVLCTTIILVSYSDKVRMFVKDDNFDFSNMFTEIENWSNISLEGGTVLSSKL